MPNIKPISDLRNYATVLETVQVGKPLREKYIWIRQELERIKHNLAYDNNIVMV